MKNIIGHEVLLKELNNILTTNMISHSYLFSGISGIGKFLVAREFARAIMCSNSKLGDYCGKCESCKLFDSMVDFKVVEPIDGSIKVDAIRELCKDILIKPTTSDRRVFIIKDAELMNDSAQNALLKSLEEPPEYATIILVTSNKSKLRKTILSRCTKIEFKGLANSELIELAKKNNIEIDEELIDYSDGSFERLVNLSNSDYMDSVILLEAAVQNGNILNMNRALKELRKNKNIKEEINDILNLLIIKLSKNVSDNYELKTRQISIIEEVRSNISKNANLDTSLDYMMVKLWEVKRYVH